MTLNNEYRESCSKLQIVKPLELKETLGGPKFPTITFQLPDDFSHFLGELLTYKSRVEGHEGFLAANPDFQKNLEAKNAEESAPFEFEKVIESKWARV